ncbi:MAG: 23S rRNA (guanosine(2251)-2'-O)-methyltransferase RlmB [Campylobacterales bacterium]
MIIFGKRVVLHALKKHRAKVQTLYLAKELDKKLFGELVKAGVRIERVDAKKAQGLAHGGNHQGMLAKIEPLLFADNSQAINRRFAVMTIGVTDMGNLGAIARTAWALGAEALVVSGVNQLNLEGLIRTSSGAALDMPLFLMPNSAEAVEHFKQAGFFTIGATLDGADTRDFSDCPAKRLLVLGAEDEGLPGRIERKLDARVTIPMAHGFDSLNVSAAAAILIDRIRK